MVACGGPEGLPGAMSAIWEKTIAQSRIVRAVATGSATATRAAPASGRIKAVCLEQLPGG